MTSCCVCHIIDKTYSCWLPLQVLTHPDDEVAKVWLEDCRHSFAQMIHDKLTRDAEEAKTKVGAYAWSRKCLISVKLFVKAAHGKLGLASQSRPKLLSADSWL